MTTVVVASSSFPRWKGDAAGRFVFDLGCGLVERGFDLRHVVPAAEGAMSVETADLGMRIRRVEFGAWAASIAYGRGIGPNLRARPWLALALPRWHRTFAAAIEAECRDSGAEMILSHWVAPAGLAAARAARRLGLRHIGIVHGGALQTLLGMPLGKRVVKRWLAGLEHAVFVSKDLEAKARRALGADFSVPSSVVPMGVRNADFAPRGRRDGVRERLGLNAEHTVVAFIGRLIELKGCDLVLDAARGLEGTQVVVVGDGPQRSRLEDQARRLRLDARFLGERAHHELPGLLEAADIVCVTSRLGFRGRSEGTPLVVLEALAAGKPIVATRTGGVPEVLADGVSGLLVPPDDVEALRAALLRVKTDVDLRQRIALGAVAAAERHDYTRAAVRLAALMNSHARSGT